MHIHINKLVKVCGNNRKTDCPNVYTVHTFSLTFYRSIVNAVEWHLPECFVHLSQCVSRPNSWRPSPTWIYIW